MMDRVEESNERDAQPNLSASTGRTQIIFAKNEYNDNSEFKELKIVGKSINKIDAGALSCGKPLFTADFLIRDLLYGKILRSPHPHALIKRIDTKKVKKLNGVKAVLTHNDLPRIPHTTAGQGYPEPSPYDTFTLDKKVRFVGDRVCAVAAESKKIAEEACSLIDVEYEILPPLLDFEKAMEKNAPIVHDEEDCRVVIPVKYEPKRNLAANVEFEVGSVENGFSSSSIIVENTFYNHYAQHTPIEPHVVITYFDEYGRLIIRTSTQVPFHVRRIVAQALDIPVGSVRVIKPRIGGGFGAKQEVLIEDICAALTLKTKRPVLLEYSRAEEFVSSRTRHPMRIQIKTSVKSDGSVNAISMDVLSNTGAYGSHALTVGCNTGSKTLPLYRWENIKFTLNTVYTNLPVGGAYRGYGATQAAFALESQMDVLAERLKIDPCEFRKKNAIRVGETSPIFKALGEGKEGVSQSIRSSGLIQCIDIGAQEIEWVKKRKENKKGILRRGVGMAALMQGSSIPEIDMGACTMKMNEDGSFNLLLGATDLGTGSDTVMAQIAAEVLSIPTEKIIVYSSDTDMTPFDVGAYASSTTYLSGNAVKKCSLEIKKQILKVGAEILNEGIDDLYLTEESVTSKKTNRLVLFSKIALYSLYQANQFQIQAVSSHITHLSPPPFAAHFAEVEVDTETGRVRVIKYVACVDCGQPINPALCEGQTEGAILNGISYALCEEFIFDGNGRVLNDNFKDYKIYSTRDLPEIVVKLVPTYEESGPFGAKSVSEISINGPLPAVANAIYNAVGVRLFNPPFTEQKILRALKEQKAMGQF